MSGQTIHPDEPQRDRAAMAADADLSMESLVGSWFHRLENDRMVWQGIVVAEPQPGVYLLHGQRLDIGASDVQVVMPLDRMSYTDEGYEWRFYNTEQDALRAFATWQAFERERA